MCGSVNTDIAQVREPFVCTFDLCREAVWRIFDAMKAERLQLRIEPSLKRSFESAASYQHQSLSQFLIQSGIAAVEAARARGLGIKAPPKPRDARRKRPMAQAVAA